MLFDFETCVALEQEGMGVVNVKNKVFFNVLFTFWTFDSESLFPSGEMSLDLLDSFMTKFDDLRKFLSTFGCFRLCYLKTSVDLQLIDIRDDQMIL